MYVYMYYIAFPWWHIGKACNPSNKTNQIQIHQIASRYVHRQRWYTETNFSLQMQGWYQQKYFTSSDHFLVGVFLFQSVCSHDMALVRSGYTTKLPNKFIHNRKPPQLFPLPKHNTLKTCLQGSFFSKAPCCCFTQNNNLCTKLLCIYMGAI